MLDPKRIVARKAADRSERAEHHDERRAQDRATQCHPHNGPEVAFRPRPRGDVSSRSLRIPVFSSPPIGDASDGMRDRSPPGFRRVLRTNHLHSFDRQEMARASRWKRVVLILAVVATTCSSVEVSHLKAILETCQSQEQVVLELNERTILEHILSLPSSFARYELGVPQNYDSQSERSVTKLGNPESFTKKLLSFVYENCCAQFTDHLKRVPFFFMCDAAQENDREDELETLFTRARNHARHWIQHMANDEEVEWMLPLYDSLYQRCITDKLENLA